MSTLPFTSASRGTVSDDDIWARLGEAGVGAGLLAPWLSLLCRQLPGVAVGLVLLAREGGGFVPAAIWPERARDVSYLTASAERAIAGRQGLVEPGESGQRSIIAYPVESGGHLSSVVIVDCSVPASDARDAMRRVQWASGWLEALARETEIGQLRVRADRAAAALDVLAAAGEQGGFDAIALAVVNEVASAFGCARVSLGLLRRSGIRLAATSHAAWFDRRADLISAIEAAMEEGAFQSGAIHFPREGGNQVDIAHRTLAGTWGSRSIVTVPIREGGRVRGALTAERTGADALTPADAATLDLIAALLGPFLGIAQRERRVISGRGRAWIGTALRRVFGARYPAAKLGTLLALLVVGLLCTSTGELRVTARSVLEGSVQRAAVASFEGYVRDAPVRAGEIVAANQLLASLDDRDLRFERLKWEIERGKLEQRERESVAKNDRAGYSAIIAQLAQADAERALVDEKLARTQITAPIAGVVVSGDLSQMLGAPVETGKILFEIAPLDSYRVVLQVSEFDIRHVRAGQEGVLALTGAAADAIPFVVSAVTPVSTPQDGHNHFRVEARLVGSPGALRPGMEGIGKIRVGEEPLLWTWSRGLIERTRLLLWTWIP